MDLPLVVMDAVIAMLDTFGGKLEYFPEVLRTKGGGIEVAVQAVSAQTRVRQVVFGLTGKRAEYPADVWTPTGVVRTGYRRCDTASSLKCCLLSVLKHDLTKLAVADVIESPPIKTLFKKTKC